MTEQQQSSYLTREQIGFLLQGLEPYRVQHKQGQSHLQAWDIRRFLNRVFGFGRWDSEVTKMELVGERPGKSKNGADCVTVVYRAQVVLRVRAGDGTELATYSEWAAGDAINFPLFKYGDAHDFAMKTAESQALKRCAINLGDQFGLSLYDKGSTQPVVMGTFVGAIPVEEEKLAITEQVGEEQLPDDIAQVLNENAGEPVQQDVQQQAGQSDTIRTVDDAKVAIMSLSADHREQLKFHWNLNSLPHLEQLNAEQLAILEGIIREIVSQPGPEQPTGEVIPDNEYMN